MNKNIRKNYRYYNKNLITSYFKHKSLRVILITKNPNNLIHYVR